MELYLEVRKMYHGNRASRALSNSETWHRHPTGTRRPGACDGGHRAVRGASERRDCHSHLHVLRGTLIARATIHPLLLCLLSIIIR